MDDIEKMAQAIVAGLRDQRRTNSQLYVENTDSTDIESLLVDGDIDARELARFILKATTEQAA